MIHIKNKFFGFDVTDLHILDFYVAGGLTKESSCLLERDADVILVYADKKIIIGTISGQSKDIEDAVMDFQEEGEAFM